MSQLRTSTTFGQIAAAGPADPLQGRRTGFSVYLDLVRCLAAVAVLANHFLTEGWIGFYLPQFILPGRLGHAGVVIFFALSGYVITYAALLHEKKLGVFAINRLSRIYSVVIPALLITIPIDLILLSSGHQSISTTGIWTPIVSYPFEKPWLYLPLYLGFGTDLWFLDERAFSNAPFWSLSYECWYYVFFGIVWFGRGKWRIAGAALAFAIMGPRLWLELPVWFVGSIVCRLHCKELLPLTVRSARWLLAGSLALMIVFLFVEDSHSISSAIAHSSFAGLLKGLRYSITFADDWILAALCAVNIYAARYAKLSFRASRKAITGISGWTMSIYLFHYPLAELCAGYLGLTGLPLLLTVGVAIYLLGFASEHQKKRWRTMFARILLLPSRAAALAH